ncbi:MAG: UDP-2,4-diacetamido-2,4,6-trideoxy-beta-L-altropyranose hydrolase [Bacteroidota bacterium]
MHLPEIAIRADGNATIGLGHIHRAIALSGYLKDFFHISFYSFGADNLVSELIRSNGYVLHTLDKPDFESPALFAELISKNALVVLDGYNFKTAYQEKIKANGNKVIAIDDLNEWENVADVVINHGFSGNKKHYKIAAETQFYGGLKYALIKQQILNKTIIPPVKSVDKILVCIGGTDPANHSTRIVKELLVNTTKEITLLTYPLNPEFEFLNQLVKDNSTRLKLLYSLNTNEIIELISEMDIAILQPSNIALEAAALGVYIILLQTADNQKYILDTLINSQCAVAIKAELANQVNSITPEQVNNQTKLQLGLLDKKSPARILEIANTLFVDFRPVDQNDGKLIYDWNNDKVTRQNSYNQSAIKYDDHLKWFHGKIKDNTVCFLLFSFNTVPAGCVRIECREKENIVGITIAPEMRRKKLAGIMLKQSADYFFKTYFKTEITAYIKKDNIPSLKSFENAGYVIQDLEIYNGEESYKLIKKAHANV